MKIGDHKMKTFEVGGLVRYTTKNELGVIGALDPNRGARVWYHMGATRSMSPFDIIEPITLNEALYSTFSNEYAKASLIERMYRVKERGDTTDLIDDAEIRPSVRIMMKSAEDSK